MMRIPYLIVHRFSDAEPRTLMLNSASEEQVNYFMQELAPKQSLDSVFGSPTRGYAGANIQE